MNYYFLGIKRYAEFSGRSSRSEYWYFFLFNILIAFGLGFLEGYMGVYPNEEESVFMGIYQLFILLPSLAISIRRMHDVNKSGWFILIPIYSWILLLTKGDKNENRFGNPPNNK